MTLPSVDGLDHSTGAENVAVIITLSGVPGYRIVVTSFSGSFLSTGGGGATPASPVTLTLTGDDLGTLYRMPIDASAHFVTGRGVEFGDGEDVFVQLNAAGAGIQCAVSATWFRRKA